MNDAVSNAEKNILTFFKKSIGSATYEDMLILGNSFNVLMSELNKLKEEANQLKDKKRT